MKLKMVWLCVVGALSVSAGAQTPPTDEVLRTLKKFDEA